MNSESLESRITRLESFRELIEKEKESFKGSVREDLIVPMNNEISKMNEKIEQIKRENDKKIEQLTKDNVDIKIEMTKMNCSLESLVKNQVTKNDLNTAISESIERLSNKLANNILEEANNRAKDKKEIDSRLKDLEEAPDKANTKLVEKVKDFGIGKILGIIATLLGMGFTYWIGTLNK